MERPSRKLDRSVIKVKPLGRYIITSDGEIWSKVSNRWLSKFKIGKDRNYWGVQIRLTGRKRTQAYPVHRMVAIAFNNNADKLETVNHINEDTLNNNSWNLEWMSRGDNARYSFAKTFTFKYGEGLVTFHNMNEFCRKNNLSIGNMYYVLKGIRKSHKGYSLP